MPVTNENLYDKLEKIHSRINKVFGVANENTKNIAILVEQTKNQNGRIKKCESEMEGMEGSMRDAEAAITDVARIQSDCLKGKENASRRGWDRHMALFGGTVSATTGIIVGIVILIARLVWGV